MSDAPPKPHNTVTIAPFLNSLRPTEVKTPRVDANEVAYALANLFEHRLSDVQAGVLLHDLYITRLEQRPDILAKCASVMRAATRAINMPELKSTVQKHSKRIGAYKGGLCDIVGTGGDGHSTFNISTAASIVSSSLLYIAKHGSKASTSKSGAADVLKAMNIPSRDGSSTLTPDLEAVNPQRLLHIFTKTKYAFLFAWNYHPGVAHAAHVRREIGHPTIFNLLGPLANPVDALIEARVIGVRSKDLVPVFAEALKLNGKSKAMVVCGAEDLDEISCAGLTYCARLVTDSDYEEIVNGTDTNATPSLNSVHDQKAIELATDAKQARVRIEYFTLQPADFGLPAHPLNTVSPGLTPQENAQIMHKLLSGQMFEDDAILHFVLMNTAAMFVVAGVCEGSDHVNPFGLEADQAGQVITERGPGNGRWKEGIRLARMAISSGKAMEMFQAFVEATNEPVDSA